MADYKITQKKSASLTYTDDWTDRLAKAYPASNVTITSATSPSPVSGIVVSAVVGTGKSITFHLATAGVTGTVPEDIVITLVATLSNGDTDPRDLIVGVTA